MLISRIQKDLFDFIESDPEDSVGLIQFWYIANSVALSAALTEEKGLKIILNSSSISHFQELSKKLFLVADKIILRDTNNQYKESGGMIPIPDGNYKPGYIDETIEILKTLKPSPLTLNYNPPRIWSSDGKKLNNGLDIHYAMQLTNYISEDFAIWISSTGKEYLKTGKIIYAPFIPPIEQELEFLKHNVSVSSTFGATPCFHQNYDWLSDSMLSTLVSLKFPFIDNIDLSTLDKVKEDNYEEFQNFSKSILDSIYKVKSAFGTEEFLREVRYIQKNDIDDNFNKINKKVKQISNYSSLRKLGIVTGHTGLSCAMLLGTELRSVVTGVAAALIDMIANKAQELKENDDIQSEKFSFLLKLGEIEQNGR